MPADKLEEWWDIYDQAEHKIGQHQRSETLRTGEYHLVANIFLFNQAGEVLLQQRSFDKLNYPGAWDCSVGGSVLAGETPLAAMVREVHEELGLTVTQEQLQLFDHQIAPTWIEYWFVAHLDFELSDVTIQTEEVAQVGFFNLSQAQKQLAPVGGIKYEHEVQLAWQMQTELG